MIEHLHFKKTEKCFSACLKSHFLYLSQFHNFLLRRLFEAAFINLVALNCGVYSRAAFNRGRRLIE